MSASCTACKSPTADGIFLCHADTTKLEYDLAEVQAVWDDLQTTVARMDKGADSVGGGGPSGSRPPLNLGALDKGQQLHVVLTGWAQLLPGLRPSEPTAVASWLLGKIPGIRKNDWAGDLTRELREALNACRAATDRAADRISLGKCGGQFAGVECADDVTAIVGATEGRCRTCGRTVNVKEHQMGLISSAWHVHRPLPDILRALKTQGVHLPLKRVEKWVERGKLVILNGTVSPAAVMEAYRATPTGRKEKCSTMLDVA